MIELLYLPTANGKAATILINELGLEANIYSAQSLEEKFERPILARWTPMMVDTEPNSVQEPITISEPGAILMYLAEKSGRFCPEDLQGKWEVSQWVMRQITYHAPVLREWAHFRRLGEREGDQSYAIHRYAEYAKSLFGILDNRLADRSYLGGDDYTIADMIWYAWSASWEVQGGQNLNEFEYFKRWLGTVGERPAVKKGMGIGIDTALPLPAPPHPLIGAIDQLSALAGDPSTKYRRRGPRQR